MRYELLPDYGNNSVEATSGDKEVASSVFRHVVDGTGFARKHTDEQYGIEYVADHRTYIIISRGGRLLAYIPRIYTELTRTRMSLLRRIGLPITAGPVYNALMSLTDSRIYPNKITSNPLTVFFKGDKPYIDVSDTPDTPLTIPFELLHDLIRLGIKPNGICHVLGRSVVSLASESGIRIFYSTILGDRSTCLGVHRPQISLH